MVTLIVISKKDGGDWLPEITKANKNRQPVVHVQRLILGRAQEVGKSMIYLERFTGT